MGALVIIVNALLSCGWLLWMFRKGAFFLFDIFLDSSLLFFSSLQLIAIFVVVVIKYILSKDSFMQILYRKYSIRLKGFIA